MTDEVERDRGGIGVFAVEKRAALLYVALVMVQRSIGFVLLPFLARAMSVSDFGVSALLLIGNLLLVAVLASPLEPGVFRWTVLQDRDPTHAHSLAAARCWLLVVAPAACCLTALGLWLHDGLILQVPTRLWAIEAVAAAFMVYVTSFAQVSLRASERLRGFAVVALTLIITLVATKVWFIIVMDLGVTGWALADLIAGAAAFAVALPLTRPITLRTHMGAVLRAMRFTAPMVPHVLSLWAMNSLSRPLAALFLPLSEVGIYAAAYNLAFIGQILLLECNRSLSPRFARAGSVSHNPSLRHLSCWIVWISVALSCAFALGAYPTEHFYLPANYEGVARAMVVLAFLSVSYGTFLVSYNFLVLAEGYTGLSWLSPLIGVLTMCALNALLTPAMGVLGAAAAAVAGHAVMGAVEFGVVRWRHLDVSYSQCGFSPGNVALSVAAMSVAAAGVWFDPPLWIFGCAVSVTALLLWVGMPRGPRKASPKGEGDRVYDRSS